MFGAGSSSFETIEHDLHRVRRGAFAGFFSRTSVQKIEPLIQSHVSKLVERLQRLRGSGVLIKLQNMYGSLTGDIIGQYGLGTPYNLLDDPDFSPLWHGTWQKTGESLHVMNHFPWMMPLMQAMPAWVVDMSNPPVGILLRLLKVGSSIPSSIW
jgi:cytochrome P450